MRRGCPSTPSRCCSPKSHNTVMVEVPIDSLVEVSVGRLVRAIWMKVRRAASTAKSAAMESTRWKCPTT